MIKKFKEFLNESNNDYVVGDVVLIRYYLTGDMTPVKILSINGNKITVSHRDAAKQGITTYFVNAPDQTINKYEIVSRYVGVDTPVEPNFKTMNPTYAIPDNTGAKGDPYKSNDLNMQ